LFGFTIGGNDFDATFLRRFRVENSGRNNRCHRYRPVYLIVGEIRRNREISGDIGNYYSMMSNTVIKGIIFGFLAQNVRKAAAWRVWPVVLFCIYRLYRLLRKNYI
jgi:hypothetical protein